MRKKGIPEVMSLYEGAKIRIRVDSEMSQEFEVEVAIHQGSVLSPFFFILKLRQMLSLNWTDGALCEFLHADDLVLMSEIIEGIRNMLIKWKKAFVGKDFGKQG